MTDDSSSTAVDEWISQMPGADRLPFSPRPPSLYSVADLYSGYNIDEPESWQGAWDTRVYDWTLHAGNPRNLSVQEIVATRLHDAAMDLLVRDFVQPTDTSRTIGFMGGHDILRTAVAYARVAKISRELRRRGFKIVTGGGPGLMEAANLGAFLAPRSDADFDSAIAILRSAPDAGSSRDPKVALAQKSAWIQTAAQVRQRLLGAWTAREEVGGESLGIPTWYYGAEPPNLFASSSGKYFMNSLREDGLVSIANGGLLFGKGSAGTVQEVFQNATYNYYRKPGTDATPMVFLDIDFWNPGPLTDAAAGAPLDPKRKPVFPLIEKLALDSTPPFTSSVMLSNDPDEIAEFLSSQNSGPLVPRHADVRLKAASSLPTVRRA